nr:AMP-binding protein [Pseudomonas duriflava]
MTPAVTASEGLEGALTLGQSLARIAMAFPEREAFVSTRFAPFTYGELQRQIERTRIQLREAGLGSQARIGIIVPETAQAALAIIAVACSAIAVPLDPRLTATEFDQLLGMLGLDALLLMQDEAGSSYPPAEHCGVALIKAVAEEEGMLGFNLAASQVSAASLDEEPEPEAPAFILRSSGTTALPKLIPFSHQNLLAAAERWKAWFQLAPDNRCLCVSAPYYSHGLKVTILAPLLAGGSVAFPLSAATVDVQEWFEDLQPTWYSAGPAIHQAIVDIARSRSGTFRHQLCFASSGGAPLSAEVKQDLQDVLGIPILEHYGSSEAAQIAANTPFPGESKAGTVGRPWPGSVLIVDESGAPLASGQRGEILISGPTLMSGYLGDTSLNEAAFTNGWFRSGDIGSLDEEGFLTLHGRLREVINRGGEKVSLQEVDEALMRHPAVLEAAAFSMPHPRLGQDVAAAVVVRPEATVNAAALREFLRNELVYFKIPRRILIVDQLPRGLTGKIQRQRLTEALIATKEQEADACAGEDAPLSSLESSVLAIWQRLLKTQAVTVEDNFFDKGGDSLLATEMLVEIEQLLGRVVPEAILAETDTLKELVVRLENLATHFDPVIEFNSAPDRTPLFWFHGDFAQGGYYIRRMAKLLGPQQPITAIAPHGLGNEPIPDSVENMARERLPYILERQATGPYRLGGYCNGALVAFEAARLLIEAGHSVEIVTLIDPPTANVRPWSRLILKTLGYILPDRQLAQVYVGLSRFGETSKWPYPKRIGHVLAKLYENGMERLAQVRGGQSTKTSEKDWEIHQRFLQYSNVMARYLPTRLAAPVVYFSADYTSRAWRQMGVSFESFDVQGGHHRCIKDYTASITTPLSALLERTTTETSTSSALLQGVRRSDLDGVAD